MTSHSLPNPPLYRTFSRGHHWAQMSGFCCFLHWRQDKSVTFISLWIFTSLSLEVLFPHTCWKLDPGWSLAGRILFCKKMASRRKHILSCVCAALITVVRIPGDKNLCRDSVLLHSWCIGHPLTIWGSLQLQWLDLRQILLSSLVVRNLNILCNLLLSSGTRLASHSVKSHNRNYSRTEENMAGLPQLPLLVFPPAEDISLVQIHSKSDWVVLVEGAKEASLSAPYLSFFFFTAAHTG